MKAKLWIYTKDVRNSFELLDREENRLQKE